MSLENAYTSVPKTSISTFSCAGRMPIMQRDEIFVNLENDIVSQMMNALPKEIQEIIKQEKLKQDICHKLQLFHQLAVNR